jgi:threonylcarbamoyladenosine tRNA methylthiotransferase MtaB
MARRLRRVSIQTTGCRLNQYESEKMAASLNPYGFERVEKGEKADLYIINTCTVTHKADRSSRNLIRRAARENPDGHIVVAGCYIDSDPETVAGMEGVDVIIKNSEKKLISEILPRRLPDLFDSEPDKNCSASIGSFAQNNRAWLGISDGCNQRCAYCILPSVRGKLRHRSAREIIGEVKELVGMGFREVVLTGLNIGYYRNKEADPPVINLAALCQTILDDSGIERIRLSSIEPQTVKGDLVQLFGRSNRRICRHLHMSLQSGSPRLLRLMRRHYTPEMYAERVSEIKAAQPNTVVGADIIVGFPGETDADFSETRELVSGCGLDYFHVFSYSDRPGIAAAQMPDKIHPEVIKERNAILTRISRDLRLKAYQRQVGETLDVISEYSKTNKGFHYGVSDNYVKVRLPKTHGGGRDIVSVKITRASQEYVEGDIVPQL